MGRNMNTRWWDVLYDMWHKEQQHLKHRTKGAAFGAPHPDCCDPERPSPREKRPISTRSAVKETPGSSSSSVKVPWVLNVQLAVSAELLLHSLSLFCPSFSTFFFPWDHQKLYFRLCCLFLQMWKDTSGLAFTGIFYSERWASAKCYQFVVFIQMKRS